MKYEWIYRCSDCGREERSPAMYGRDDYPCVCSHGTMYHSGESYDQEFVDQQRYEKQQDREYEERHRGEYYDNDRRM